MDDDPWYWGVERVVAELCSTSGTWNLTQPGLFPGKLPAPDKLRPFLTENEVEGNVLLTAAYGELWHDLHIEKLSHKTCLRLIIDHLRRKSSRYRRESKQKGVDAQEEEQDDLRIREEQPTSNCLANSTTVKLSAAREQDVQKSSKKKRRVIPQNLNSEPIHSNPALISSYGQDIFKPYRLVDDVMQSSSPRESLALKPIYAQSFLDSYSVFDTQGVSPTQTFSFVACQLNKSSKRLATRQRAVYRSLKKYLMRRPTPTTTLDERDEVLPLFGESDEEMDEEIWKEIEEEEEDQMKEKSKLLSSTHVAELIEEGCQKYRWIWMNTKRPRQESNAYKIWIGARSLKNGLTRQDRIAIAVREQQRLEKRLEKIKTEMHKNQYKSQKALQEQLPSLEATVMDLEAVKHDIQILALPNAPPRPDTTRRAPRAKARRPLGGEGLSSDEEIIVSEDDGIDDFVEYDEPVIEIFKEPPRRGHAHHTNPPMTLQPQGPSTINSIIIGSDSDTLPDNQCPQKPVPIIDLTADTPSTATGIHHMIRLHDRIQGPPAELGLNFEQWNRLPDTEKSLLWVIWQWDKDVRDEVFKSYRSSNLRKLWFDYVLAACNMKPEENSSTIFYNVAVSWVRFFDTYIQGPEVKRQKFKKADKIASAAKNRCMKHSSRWEDFYKRFGDFMEYFDQDSDLDIAPPFKRKTLVLNQDAANLRSANERRLQEQAERRRTNREALSSLPAAEQRLVINDSKAEEDGFVYVNDNIAKLIKDYQVEGVRFMWNQVVAGDPKKPQGCLLAHTMGLGKTMQVITLLVAISEASASLDESVQRQVPANLQESKTLIMCPPTLVDNWANELAMWDENGVLGEHLKAISSLDMDAKATVIERWSRHGGVLVMGYPIFRSFFFPRRNQSDSDCIKLEALKRILIEQPRIVVADEAHILKNEDSKIGFAASQFQTGSRIALTGSPLSNSVLEYYSMINWVSENFLGPRKEFNLLYAKPIQDGLWQSSDEWLKRRALKKLKVLGDTVQPKVHRRTMASLKNCLPPKQEFVIHVPLTGIQRDIYDFYCKSTKAGLEEAYGGTKISATEIFGLLNVLGLVCNHPKIYHTRLTQRSSASKTKYSSNSPADTEVEDGRDVQLSSSFIENALRTISTNGLGDVRHSWKVKLLLKILRESQKMGDKVLVFSQSILTLDFLESLLQLEQIEAKRLDGKTKMSVRQSNVEHFNQNSSLTAYLISTRAGGLGLNIHGANRVVIFDFLWNPSEESQSLGRAYRIGQKKPVTVYRFVSAGTFETKKLGRVIFKLQLFSRVVDNKRPVAYSEKVNLSLLDPVENVVPEEPTEFRGKDVIFDSILQDIELSQGVTKVMGFDSIYEEDVEAALTEQEKRDAEDEMKRWKSDISNPRALGTLNFPRNILGEVDVLPSIPEKIDIPMPHHIGHGPISPNIVPLINHPQAIAHQGQIPWSSLFNTANSPVSIRQLYASFLLPNSNDRSRHFQQYLALRTNFQCHQ